MATEGKRIAQKLEESALIADVLVPKAAALINRELEAERKAVDELLRVWQKIHDYTSQHCSCTDHASIDCCNNVGESCEWCMVDSVSDAAARLRKMRLPERISENRNLEKTK